LLDYNVVMTFRFNNNNNNNNYMISDNLGMEVSSVNNWNISLKN